MVLVEIFLWLMLVLIVLAIAAHCLRFIVKIAAGTFISAVAVWEFCAGAYKWIKPLFRRECPSGGVPETTVRDKREN